MIIKKIGLEIRRVGNFDDLYNEVDIVLSKSSNIQFQTVGHALHKMFNCNNYLDVCTIRNCADVANIVIPKEHMEIYSAIHCIHWSEMDKEYCKTVIAMVLSDFRPIFLGTSGQRTTANKSSLS